MNREDLLTMIAEAGYNVGFGAKKHFATYDLVTKFPGYIRFFSITCGIYSLAFDNLSSRFLSASLIVLGVVSLYVSFYNSKRDEYESAGKKLTRLFNSLKELYYRSKAVDDTDSQKILEELKAIEAEYYEKSVSKQILFSDWYAHYKFFWEFQIDWVDEQKQFRLLRDKIPLTVSLSFLLLLLVLGFLVFKGRLLLLYCSMRMS